MVEIYPTGGRLSRQERAGGGACKGQRKKVKRNVEEKFDVRSSTFEVEEKRKGRYLK